MTQLFRCLSWKSHLSFTLLLVWSYIDLLTLVYSVRQVEFSMFKAPKEFSPPLTNMDLPNRTAEEVGCLSSVTGY